MAYRISRKKSVQSSVRKIALEQIDKAIAEINDEELDREETVHQVRKRCKKLRGLIRLVRPSFDDYKRENTFFRELALDLSYIRDAQVATETFDKLAQGDEAEPHSGTRFANVRKALEERRTRVLTEAVDLDKRLAKSLKKLHRVRRRAKHWKIDDIGFAAVEGGLKKTYKRARKALRQARENPTGENFHSWRKRVKYHWYHDRLLRRIWGPMMKVQCDAGDELGELLGDDHDLVVIRQLFLDREEQYGDERDMKQLIDLIDQRNAELRRQARPLGDRLFAEKLSQLVDRYRCYWKTWRSSR